MSLDIPQPTPEDAYFKAIELTDPAERAAYLDDACGADERFRQRVERLLDARARRGDFLNAPALPGLAVIEQQSVEEIGTTIGPYKLLEEIGEGGMGVVYMAEQTQPVRRRVALKIIKPGMDTRQVIARFEAERQALALMDHPNIARVFDAGATSSGRPYFAMELVRGIPITEYCDRVRMALRERLTLFVQVCRAVQHAHQKGVIHRDLKPSNLLVTEIDGAATPKVIDFGVVKAVGVTLTERTLFTGFHQFIGTPLYMSPEQADVSGVDVDTRSDIYALGVLLYELLTGTTPLAETLLRDTPLDEFRRIVREVDPPRPSARLNTLSDDVRSTMSDKRRANPRQLGLSMRGELDWIVMKALEKDRHRRYETASDFAADVQHYLADEPVDACPPSRRYRVAKFVRRHRVALLSATVVAAALLVGLGASIWQAMRATAAEHDKSVALAQARRAVDEMYTKVADKWLADQGSLSTVQRELLESAAAFYESLSEDAETAPELQYESLRALGRVGHIRQRLGDNVEAQDAFQRVVEQSKPLIRDYPDRPEFRVERLIARNQLASIFRRTERRDDADRETDLAQADFAQLDVTRLQDAALRQRLAQALSGLSSTLLGVPRVNDADAAIQASIRLWKSLTAEDPAKFEYRFGLAEAQVRLGTRQMWMGTSDEANLKQSETSLREADVMLTTLLEERPGDRGCRRMLDQTLGNLGIALAWMSRSAETVEIERRCLTISESLAKEFPDDADIKQSYLQALNNLTATLHATNLFEPGEELELLQQTHGLAASSLVQNPDMFECQLHFLQSLITTTHLLYDQDKREEAYHLHQRAAHHVEAIRRAPHNELSIAGRLFQTQVLRAAVLVDFGEYANAAKLIEGNGMARFHAHLPMPSGADPNEVAVFCSDVLFKADALLTRACVLRACSARAEHDESLLPDERAALVKTYTESADARMGQAELALGQWAQAILTPPDRRSIEAAYQGEQRIRELAASMEHGNKIPCLREAARAQSRSMHRQLVQAAATVLADEPDQHRVSLQLSTAPSELRDVELALKLARRAVELAPDDDESRQALGHALFRAGQCEASLPYLQETAIGADVDPKSALTMALWRLGREDEARAVFAGAVNRLDEYVRQCEERDRRSEQPFPTAAMAVRLHKEAMAMLGDPSPSAASDPTPPMPPKD